MAATTMAISAMLKAGQCQPRRWKSRKSMTGVPTVRAAHGASSFT